MNIQELRQAISPYLQSKEGQIWLLLLTVITTLVLVTLVWQSAQSIHLLTANRQPTIEHNIVQTNKPVVSTIMNAPLFGQGELPGQTNTHYQLIGVLFTQDLKHGKAIIGSPNRDPEIYQVDQNLNEGGKLAQVNTDHVLIMRNGQLEKLYLSWEGGAPASVGPKQTMPSQPSELAMTGDEEADSQAEADAWRQRIKELQQKYRGQMNQASQAENIPGRFGPRMIPG